MNPLERLGECLHRSRRVLLLSHVNPDVDTLGAMLALKLALEGDGRDVTAYNPSGVPPSMRFLPGSGAVVTGVHPRRRFDATVALDSSTPDRFGELIQDGKSRKRLGTLIKIDHHLDGTHWADLEFVDPTRASAAELVVELLDAYPLPLNADIALNVYSAIVSDTGGFRYSNTNRRAFACAARMLDLGVDPWYVTTMLYENRPIALMRLLAEVLATLEVSPDGSFATLSVTREAMQRTGAEDYMLDGLVNYARSIQGVEVAMLLREDGEDGRVRISFRSKGKVNVAALAKNLGGGGHHNAAGGSIEGPLVEAKSRLHRMVARALPRLKPPLVRLPVATRTESPRVRPLRRRPGILAHRLEIRMLFPKKP